MRILRIVDAELIRSTMTHPKVYPFISDDGSPEAAKFSPIISDQIYYMAAYDGDEYMGLFMYHPHNSVCYEVHTCLLPSAWGERAIECAKASLRWIFDNTKCQRVVTNVPNKNRLAMRLAENAGLSKFGKNSKSFMKNGILHDQVMLGLNKE